MKVHVYFSVNKNTSCTGEAMHVYILVRTKHVVEMEDNGFQLKSAHVMLPFALL